MPPRITYNSINLDLGRDWNTYSDPLRIVRSKEQALGGIADHNFFYKEHIIRAELRLLAAQEVRELEYFANNYAHDGSSFEFWRDFNLGGYWNFDNNNLNSNDEISGTHTRSETVPVSTYFDDHLQLQVASGVTSNQGDPRFPPGKFGDGILLEGGRTNLISQIDDFTHTDWTASNITPSADTDETNTPFDTAVADKLTASADNGTITEDTNATTITTDDAVFAVFLKSDSAAVTGNLRILSSSTGELAVESFSAVPNGPDGNGFTLFWVSYESAGSVAGDFEFQIEIDTSGEFVYAYGAYAYAGTDVLFPSTLTTTRNDDLLLYPSSNIINRSKGTIAMSLAPQWEYNKHATATLFQSGADASDRHIHIAVTSAGNFSCSIFKNNSTTSAGDISTSASGLSQNTFHRLVYTYDSTIATGQNLYLDNALLDTSANTTPFNISAVGTNFALGAAINGSQEAFCVFDELEIWKDVKDSTWVNQDYNTGRGKGYGRNYFSAVRLQEFNFTERHGGRFDVTLILEEVLS